MSILHLPRKSLIEVGADSMTFPLGGWMERKMHLVKWSTVCLDKSMGGLGVKNLENLNIALLCKWSWLFASENGALWKDVTETSMTRKKGVVGEEIEGGGFWDLIFIRHPNDWEMGESVRLLSWLGPKKSCVEIDDMPWWMDTKNGVFFFRSYVQGVGA